MQWGRETVNKKHVFRCAAKLPASLLLYDGTLRGAKQMLLIQGYIHQGAGCGVEAA